ncbi:unnamed protein product [Chilo suppressalis]|uniref:FAM69 protein-kinase domain-containing protein n=1 Tax=Chilo suppressalis TaxID=168631 RepID=A0ABN8B4U9_CHISP|nr:unnamed protein product [Chilo suppressalis]
MTEKAEKIYRTMKLRRRFWKRLFLIAIMFGVSFYVSVLLFGDLKSPRVMNLTDLDRCPACYGVSVCPELYSNQIILESGHHWGNLFNAKNIYYGYTRSNRRVVLKKLAHDWELKELDTKLCKNWNLERGCKPVQLLNATNADERIIGLIQYNISWPDTEPRKGLVLCPYTYSFYDFIQPVLNNKKSNNYKSDMINVWTMLNINPEPIILQVIPKSKGWPVPSFGGVCGRLEVVAHEGEPLSSLLHIEWHRKLKFAKAILETAMDFTFKHDRFRFYLMDWSLDNIVANEKDDITFVDLEDFVILDKQISPKNDLPNWYQRYSKETSPGFTFSIESMCKHHLSDHNIWAACYILAGEENPLLYPIPKDVNSSRPHFHKLLLECLNGDDRFRTITKLQHVITDMLLDEKIVGFGAVR